MTHLEKRLVSLLLVVCALTYPIDRSGVYMVEEVHAEEPPVMLPLEQSEIIEPAEYIEEIVVPVEEAIEDEPVITVSDEEIELIALLTMGEAEDECEEGKRLVIDTILNRVDHPKWPNTIKDVIYQPKQYSCMWSDRLTRCYIREDICHLVREELVSRTNYDVLFFRMGHYFDFGTPLFKVGCHYFSGY